MIVYRITKQQFIHDLSGVGSKKYGGRWNRKGTEVIYTSSTISLGTLEVLVHVSEDTIPNDLCIGTLSFPTNNIEELDINKLPKNWKDERTTALWELTYKWLKSSNKLALKVPSVIVESEFNYILNPNHKDFVKVKLESVQKYELDKRFF